MNRPTPPKRIVIVAEHASTRFGGEAILPLHYFRILRSRDLDVHLVVHARTRDELAELLPEDRCRLHFIPDSLLHRALWRAGRPLPSRVSGATFGFASRLLTQFLARRIVGRLVREQAIQVVHQPIPVSAREPSLLFGLGVSVVIGPLNGGMSFPPAFRDLQGSLSRATLALARGVSNLANRFLPGKLQANVVLVANERTRRALPQGVSGRVIELVENGVDLATWTAAKPRAGVEGVTRFVFLGRLVDWKAVDVLLEAFQGLRGAPPCRLEIIGDGVMRPALEALAARLGIAEAVTFTGWLSHAAAAERLRSADSLVLPSLYESGGAVVLEAMATGIPVIACAWGGPTDYLDESCGILVPPTTRDALVSGFREAMSRLARSPELRQAMGRAGRERAVRDFDWERKVDRILEIYAEAVAAGDGRPAAAD
jgi:glycosyltransferase involved in cell wall biosynthesis